MRYTVFKTRYGWMGVAGTERGLSLLILPKEDRKTLLAQLKREATSDLLRVDDYFKEVKRDLVSYFQGNKVDFASPLLDFIRGTPFQRKVWKILRSIPYGEVRPYKWVAKRMGKPQATRAVGQAIGRNPLPIIVPCHRVILADGNLGGFSAGIKWKKRLQALEKIKLGLYSPERDMT